MMGLGAEVEIGVSELAVHFVSHPVFCKYLTPGMGGGLHFRFAW
jgi:hypothetical protein